MAVYAGSRQRIFLTWEKRLAIRLIPILLFISQIYRLLQAVRCQTCYDYSLYRHGDPNMHKPLDWATEGGFLYKLSSMLLFWETDERACSSVGMSKSYPGGPARYGSFALLWLMFLRVCLNHFIDTLSCSLQQRTVMTETGMSVFDHSLAFAEAEAMVSHALGLGLFGMSKTEGGSSRTPMKSHRPGQANSTLVSEEALTITRLFYLDKFNVPPEVLLIALVSCCNILVANVIAVFDKQRKLRLINTSFWGLCFMATFIWGLFHESSNSQGDTSSSILRIPTVCIVTFMPHMLIIMGMVVCAMIYALALTLTALSLGTNPDIPEPANMIERFMIAHENLHASIQFRGLELRWHEDFYTALLRVGFAALNAASEAVFLSEGRSVEVRRFTWLEEDRMDEIEAVRNRRNVPTTPSTHFHIAEEFSKPVKGALPWQSGYGIEKKIGTEKKENETTTILNVSDGQTIHPQPGPGGVGALQRSSRFYLLFVFLRGIFFLITGWVAFLTGKILDFLGITRRPRWLRRLVGASLRRSQAGKQREEAGEPQEFVTSNTGGAGLEAWFNEGAESGALRNEDIDIEDVMRRRMKMETMNQEWTNKEENRLDSHLYRWWKTGGWWGLIDKSLDYAPSQVGQEEDNTSVFSMSTSATDEDRSWDSETPSSGQRTPTQRSLFASRENTPEPSTDVPLDAAALARLLNPPDREAKAEARILASHLQPTSNPRIVTRSVFRRQMEMERSRVLLAGRTGRKMTSSSILANNSPTAVEQSRALTVQEEEEALESLILSRRQQRRGSDDDSKGPMCVVCQSSSRTIIAWPCRCLCVCEDCRVSLAMNNFSKCVTCRREVGGFVRLWVP